MDPIARGLAEKAATSTAKVPFATKLRELAKTADPSNPLLLPPWTLPASWAVSTAYSQGELVLANGYWWVCQGSGTSASSGAGPNTPGTANTVSDGTAQWLFAGAPSATANDPQAPTISRSTTTPASPNNIPWGLPVSTSAAMFRLYGGHQNSAITDRYRVATFNQAAASLDISGGGRVGFWSDAAIITLLTSASDSPYRIAVDGRYLTPSGYINGASNTYTTIDWTAVGGVKPRYYEVEGTSRNGAIFNLNVAYTSASDLIWLPSTANDVRCYWISDSQCAGHSFAAYQPGGGLAQRVARLLGWNDLWNASIGSTGYIADATGTRYTYGQRVAEGLTRNPDLWVFFGSTNDTGQTAAAVTAAVKAALQAIRSGGSTAPIIVLGVMPVNSNCPATETAIQDAVTQFGDARTFFVPLANASPYPAIIGSYNRPASMNSNVNSFGRDVNTTDSIHLMEGAHPKLARFIANAIKQRVLETGLF